MIRLRWLAVGLISFTLVTYRAAYAKVRVELLTQEVHSGMPFSVRMANDQSRSISYCVDVGRSVQTDKGSKPAPNPFYLQRWTGKRWDTQLIGTDVGSDRSLFIMGWHEAEDFQMQVNEPGIYRIQLEYSNWSSPNCSELYKHSSRVNSKSFEIR